MSERDATMGRLADWLDKADGFASITLSRDKATGGYFLTLSVATGWQDVDLAHAEGTALEKVVDVALAEVPR